MLKSIRAKFIMTVISGMLLVALTVSGISAIYIYKTLNEESNIITGSVANTYSVTLNDILENVAISGKTMESYFLSEIQGKDVVGDASAREEIIESMKSTLQNIAVNTPGIVGYFLRFNPDITTPTSGFFIGSSGRGNEFKEYEPYDLSDWEIQPDDVSGWYRKAVNNGGPTWVMPYYNSSNNIEIISYVIPVYQERELIAVVGVDVEFAIITDLVSQVTVHDYGFAYISDMDHNLIFTPANEHTMDRLDTNHGYAEEHRDLVNGMHLVVHVDYADIQGDSYRLLLVMGLIAIFILMIFILITYAITIRIIKPLKNITEAADHLVEGGYEFEVDDNVDTEISALHQVLNKASDKLKVYMTHINNLAYRDALTGVKNSTAYNETMVDIDRRMRVGDMTDFGLLVCDINRLKETNDHYGHDRGNQLIVRAAKLICTVFKHSPVYRIGGDEFVVLLEREDLENVRTLIYELDALCLGATIEVPGEIGIPVSVARGLAIYNPGTDTKFEDVFSRADQHMYMHKDETKSNKNK